MNPFSVSGDVVSGRMATDRRTGTTKAIHPGTAFPGRPSRPGKTDLLWVWVLYFPPLALLRFFGFVAQGGLPAERGAEINQQDRQIGGTDAANASGLP